MWFPAFSISLRGLAVPIIIFSDGMELSDRKPEAEVLAPLLLLVGVVILDQLSKWWISVNFSLYETREVIPGFFNITFVTNTGAAFGLLAGWDTVWRQVFFISVSLLALVALFFAYLHFRSEGRLAVYGLALVAGGAVGNLIDRLRFGRVIDFLDFYLGTYHWPAFNVADAGITIGVGLLLLSSFLHGRKEKA
jgi:signal peptidase II